MNLYAANDNPLRWTDPLVLKIDGPIHTLNQFREQLSTPAGQQAQAGGFINSDIRFVYTDSGVVDMRHAQAAFQTTRGMIDAGVPAQAAGAATYALGVGVEVYQAVGGTNASYSQPGTSAFSPEDIPSNSFGIGGAQQNATFSGFVNTISNPISCVGF